ncbi:hypothetical protein BD414DRAFT_452992 [Trametes punicea]|nr:hypothetical protein BD414DRAFT_452992 [Trametes punicea]
MTLTSRVDIEETFGAFLIGTFFAVMLYGMTIHQVYRYFRVYGHSEHWNTILVCILTVLETFHVVACTHACYHYLVKSYYDPWALATGVWSMNILGVLSGSIIISSQSYFARRIYLLGQSYRPVVLVATALLVGEFGRLSEHGNSGCVLTAKLIGFFTGTLWLVSAGAGMAVIADGLLTSVLVTVLRGNTTGIKRMDTIIEILIAFAVSTGLLTGVVNLLSFVLSLLCPSNLIYLAFGIVCTKLYANSLLAALNARRYLSERATEDPFPSSLLNVRVTRALSISGSPHMPRYQQVRPAADDEHVRLAADDGR